MLVRYALFAASLGAAGLPIYIHAPKVFSEQHGVSLTTVAALLVLLRLVDVVQDPILGWIAGRLRAGRALAAGVAALGMATGMLGIFSLTPLFAPVIWLALSLTLLFTSFSFLTILFYARGVAVGSEIGHTRIAAWREVGALIGICLASAAPAVILALGPSDAYGIFGVCFAALAVIAAIVMHREWDGAVAVPGSGYRTLFRNQHMRQLLLIGFFNAAPVAVSSTLFLFFVESRLGASQFAGPLLLAFFVAAACAAPLWTRLSDRLGVLRVLASAMLLSIAAFSSAFLLGPGDTLAFLIICILSGAALGADMTLLPAMVSKRAEADALNTSEVFGLWTFVTKLTLAIAAATVLPLLEQAGFQSGVDNSSAALTRLSLLYALLPCALKLIALALLLMLGRRGLTGTVETRDSVPRKAERRSDGNRKAIAPC